MEESCIYSCKVTREDTGGTETYTGLAGGTFKSRFYGHNGQINNRARGTNGKGTTLSQYIWDLKDSNIPFNKQMEYTSKSKTTFNPTTKNVDFVLKKSTLFCINQKQHHSIQGVKFLVGATIGSHGV